MNCKCGHLIGSHRNLGRGKVTECKRVRPKCSCKRFETELIILEIVPKCYYCKTQHNQDIDCPEDFTFLKNTLKEVSLQ